MQLMHNNVRTYYKSMAEKQAAEEAAAGKRAIKLIIFTGVITVATIALLYGSYHYDLPQFASSFMR